MDGMFTEYHFYAAFFVVIAHLTLFALFGILITIRDKFQVGMVPVIITFMGLFGTLLFSMKIIGPFALALICVDVLLYGVCNKRVADMLKTPRKHAVA